MYNDRCRIVLMISLPVLLDGFPFIVLGVRNSPNQEIREKMFEFRDFGELCGYISSFNVSLN